MKDSVASTRKMDGAGQIVPFGISSVGGTENDASKLRTSEAILVPSKRNFAGKAKT